MDKGQKQSIVLISILLLQTLGLLAYTAYVIAQHGWGFLDVAQSNVASLTWNGQFSLDFACYLLLSGLWIMWRNRFSAFSILFAIIAMILGIIVFAPYVLYLIWKEKGDLRTVLLGASE